MKRLTAILVFLCLAVQSVAQIAVVGLFELQREYIAKNLCENRDKPQLSCCGKCYLGKQLRKADNDESSSGNTPVKNLKSEVAPCVLPEPVSPAGAFVAVRPSVAQHPVLPNFHGRLLIASVFHPPARSC